MAKKIKQAGEKKAAAPARNPKDFPSPPNLYLAPGIRPIVEYQNVVAAERAVGHPVIFRCLNKIAGAVQSVPLICEKDTSLVAADQAGEMPIKAINRVLNSPNNIYTPDQLRYWMAIVYACYGRIPLKIGVGVERYPNGIYPLAARYVFAKEDDRGIVTGYEYGFGEASQQYPTRDRATAGQAYVSEIFTPTLDANVDRDRNMTTLRSIGLPSQVIDLLLRRAIDTAAGHPNNKYIVSTDKKATKKQAADLKGATEESTPGNEESGNVLFLWGLDVKIDKLDNDLNNIHSKVPMDDMTRMIAGAFDIPIALLGLGAADGAKFAGNYIESRSAFWQDTIIPRYLSPICTGLTKALCPPGARIVPDLDAVEAILDARVARAKQLTGVNFLTNDEKREIAGYAPLTADQRDELAATPPAPVATQTGTN